MNVQVLGKLQSAIQMWSIIALMYFFPLYSQGFLMRAPYESPQLALD